MTRRPLDALARRRGIALSYRRDDRRTYEVPDATKAAILAAFGVDVSTEAAIAASLADAAPLSPPELRAAEGQRCFLPDWLEEGRAWGISVQLYELRSRRNWGIGDFADLAEVCGIAARAGADFVGISPLHALFLAEPERCSPFSPSNRGFLNPLYLAVDRVPGFQPGTADAAEIERLRATERVDYAGVAALKLAALRRLWEGRRGEAGDAGAAFEAFCDAGGAALRRHALFEALSLDLARAGQGGGWSGWPQEYRDPAGAAASAFAGRHAGEVRFHMWLQWLADRQLAEAARAGREAGLRIGLYLDCAVGEVPDGSASWSAPELVVPGLSIGAPPDMYARNGQDWGLAPLAPTALAAEGCAAFARLIAATLRGAGALRIDHAMALWQLFLVPTGHSPAEGAYVRYPIERLLAVLAEVSRRHEVIVIGEDLGNVPEGFREVMEASRILSYRLLYFEERGQGYRTAKSYPRLALACLSTHDLPTLAGWWRGDDVALRREHGLIDTAAAEAGTVDRASRRKAMLRAFVAAGALPREGAGALAQAAKDPAGALPPALPVAAHRFIAKTPSVLAAARLADLTGEVRPTNLPGTVDSYPNWRLKLPVPIEELGSTELFRAITRAMAAERPRPA